MSEHPYRNCKIILQPGQTEAGKWTCQYTVIILGSPEVLSCKGYADRIFDSREDAEAAALKKAKAQIDSN